MQERSDRTGPAGDDQCWPLFLPCPIPLPVVPRIKNLSGLRPALGEVIRRGGREASRFCLFSLHLGRSGTLAGRTPSGDCLTGLQAGGTARSHCVIFSSVPRVRRAPRRLSGRAGQPLAIGSSGRLSRLCWSQYGGSLVHRLPDSGEVTSW
ncbi:hypothetical protein NDU88_007035 [Pleurodeles waltl]|uniref:Uncharacterized protein n=1 Tax=Pleurodeles waltl TaxID=8319 RepID=A0AAV7VSC3_PLEWA|nr:hypothetical protein NDU88_007035 [Pleurodeles waltl]